MKYIVNDVVNVLENDYDLDVINYGSNTIVVKKFGFDYGIIENIENKFDIGLNFQYLIDDDVEIVKIKIVEK